MGIISAGKAYSLAHEEGKKRLYQCIENAAKAGKMYYITDSDSLAQDTIDELKAAGYEITTVFSETKISWKHIKNAPNQ